MPIPRRRERDGLFRDDPRNMVVNYKVETFELEVDTLQALDHGFDSLAEALQGMQISGDILVPDISTKDNDLKLLQGHPMYEQAIKEYAKLMSVLLPGLNTSLRIPQETSLKRSSSRPNHLDAKMEEGLELFIKLTKKRTEKAQRFYSTLQNFLDEYANAVQELAAVEPLLRGTLDDKIEELKVRIKRKYGSQTEELQRECSTKRLRKNLPDEASKILMDWFADHRENPYPDEAEKKELCKKCGITKDQINNWFVNVRKRYWQREKPSP